MTGGGVDYSFECVGISGGFAGGLLIYTWGAFY